MVNLLKLWPHSAYEYTPEKAEAVLQELQKRDCACPTADQVRSILWHLQDAASPKHEWVQHVEIPESGRIYRNYAGPFSYGTGGGQRVIRTASGMS